MNQTLLSGATLQGGKYRIIDVLGQGGFGITYLAEHTILHSKLAIKEFFFKGYSSRSTTDECTMLTSTTNQEANETVVKFKKKFIKEAQLLSTLSHPNIVHVQDVFEENGTAYYVMDYIDGTSLERIVKMQGIIQEKEALEYIRNIADALNYIHEKSINHLDLKPANVMKRSQDGQIILIDFGTSKQYDDAGEQTSTTPVGISHGYAPMEQYTPGGVSQFTPQTDVYALGATLFRLLTGNVPPQAADVVSEGLPVFPSGISLATSKAIVAAMQPKKANRPSTVNEFIQKLPCDNIKQSNTRTEYKPTSEPKEANSTKYILSGLAALVIIIVGYFAFSGGENSGKSKSEAVKVEQPGKKRKVSAKSQMETATQNAQEIVREHRESATQDNEMNLQNALSQNDYRTVKSLADNGYAPACVPLAQHYLDEALAGNPDMYEMADKYAQKGKRAGVSGAQKIIDALSSLGYYD